MRFLIFLSLFMLPMVMVQFYSPDSYALTNDTSLQKTFFGKVEPLESAATGRVNKTPVSKERVTLLKQEEGASSYSQAAGTSSQHQVKGMQFLSMLLMLKDKQR